MVVPIYNPGGAFQRCIESLLGQSLPAELLELILVDDGSTDGTSETLDHLAVVHPHVRVIHQENSGWAGKPRNVGIDTATARFIQFVDQDDALGPHALERLVQFGDDNRADIVIGKVTSDFRRVPQELFRANIGRCSVRDAPLVRSLTPHKMFRREFLLDHGLRFAEGRRRLEDQLFMIQAYLATGAVAVLADYPCYFYLRRGDRGHAAMTYVEPSGYYKNLREVLDAVEAGTAPGDERNALLDRFATTLVRHVSGLPGLPRTPNRAEDYCKEVRAIVAERIPEPVRRNQPPLRRQVLTALVDGTPDDVAAAGSLAGRLKPSVTLHGITGVPGGWQLSISAELAFRDDSFVELLPAEGGWELDPRLRHPAVAAPPASIGDLLGSATGDVVVQDTASPLEWLAEWTLTPHLQPIGAPDGPHRLVVAGEVPITPKTLAAGSPLAPGKWVFSVRFAALGLTRSSALQAGADGGPEVAKRKAGNARLRYGAGGRLKLAVRAG